MGGDDRPEAYNRDEGRHTASIALYLVLTILTLGIFNLYWNYCQTRRCAVAVATW